MRFDAAMLRSKGLAAAASFAVRDLFAGKELGTFAGNFSVHVPSSGVKMVKVTAA